ncbi:MAG: hypothetical protein R2880_00505 [Deinococcales bacterium]
MPFLMWQIFWCLLFAFLLGALLLGLLWWLWSRRRGASPHNDGAIAASGAGDYERVKLSLGERDREIANLKGELNNLRLKGVGAGDALHERDARIALLEEQLQLAVDGKLDKNKLQDLGKLGGLGALSAGAAALIGLRGKKGEGDWQVDGEIQNRNRRIETLEQELAEVRTVSARLDDVGGAKIDISAWQRQLEDKDKLITSLRADLDAKANLKGDRVDELEKLLAKRDAELKALQVDFSKQQGAKGDLEAKLKKDNDYLEAQLAAFKGDVRSRDVEIRQLRVDLEKAKQADARAQELQVKLQGYGDVSPDLALKLKAEVADRNAEIKSLREHVAKLENEQAALKQDHDSHVSSVSAKLSAYGDINPDMALQLRKDVETRELEINELRDDLDSLRLDYDQLKEERERLLADKDALANNLDDLHKQQEADRQKYDVLESRVVSYGDVSPELAVNLQGDLAASRQRLGDLELELQSLRADRDRLEHIHHQTLAERETEVTSLRQNLKALSEQGDTLSAEREATLANLRLELEGLRHERNALAENLAKSQEDQEKLARNLSSLQQAHDGLVINVTQLEGEKEALAKESHQLSELQGRLVAYGDIDPDLAISLRHDVESRDIELGHLRGELTDMKSDLDNLQEERELLRLELDELHHERDRLNVNLASLQEEHNDLATNLGELQNERDSLIINITNLEQDRDNLTTEHNQRLGELEGRLVAYGDIDPDLALNLRSNIEARDLELGSLRGELGDLKSDLGNLQEERDYLRLELDDLRLERDRLSASLDDLQGERDRLSINLEGLQHERDGLTVNLNELQGERDQLILNLGELQNERDSLIINITNLEQDRDNLTTEHNQRLGELEGRLVAYGDIDPDLALSLKSDVDLRNQEIGSLRSDVEGLSTTVNSLQEERDYLRLELGELRTERERLGAGLAELQDERERLAGDLVGLQEEHSIILINLSDVQGERDNLNLNLSGLEQERNKLASDLDILAQERNRLLEDLSILQAEREDLLIGVGQLEQDRNKLLGNIVSLEQEKESLVGEHQSRLGELEDRLLAYGDIDPDFALNLRNDIDIRNLELAETRLELESLQAELDRLRSERGELVDELEGLRHRSSTSRADYERNLEHSQQQLAELQARLAAYDDIDPEIALMLKESFNKNGAEIEQLRARVTELEAEGHRLSSSGKGDADKLATNERQLAELRMRLQAYGDVSPEAIQGFYRDISSRDDELARLRLDLEALKQEHARGLANRDQRINELDKALEVANSKPQLPDNREEFEARGRRIRELEARLTTWQEASDEGIDYSALVLERDVRIAELEQDLMTMRIRNREIDPDDLKEIKGVGPVMEGKLNDFGIYTFKGVATMSSGQKYRLSQDLEHFSDRIDRDQWIPQARDLHFKKYGERLGTGRSTGDMAAMLWTDIEAKNQRIAELEAELAKARLMDGDASSRTVSYRIDSDSDSANDAKWQAELESREKELATLRLEVENLRGSQHSSNSGDLSKALSQRDEHILELETKLASFSRAGDQDYATLLLNREVRIAELEEEVNKLRVSTGSLKPDNLKEIKGVGPVMERVLNDFGIFTFRGVAMLSEAQRYRLSQNLRHFKDRIERDQWVPQAKVLHERKYGEHLD